MERKTTNIVLTILAIIGALAILATLGMWLMHVMMMGGAGMIGCCGDMGGWMVGLSLIATVIVAAVLFLRLRTRL